MKALTLTLFLTAVVLACRDSVTTPTATRSSDGPSFSNTTDTIPGGCAQPAKQCHFNSRGEAASISWFNPGTTTVSDSGGGGVIQFGSLNVDRSGSVKDQQVLLSYQVTECDGFSCTTVRGGFGLIPDADFSGNGKAFHLSTNTSTNPNFFTYGGPSGLIEAEWVDNGLFEFRFNGNSQITQPGIRSKTTGQSVQRSANANGSIVGLSIFPANQGSISLSHSVTIDIIR